jgi:hypothetical protein
MPNVSQAQLNFTTHHALIRVDESGGIFVYKHNGHGCDWEFFTDQYAAAEYIIENLPLVHYRIQFPGED